MVKVPGDALSGLAGLRLPSSTRVWETHAGNAPSGGILTWPLSSSFIQSGIGNASVREPRSRPIEHAQQSFRSYES